MKLRDQWDKYRVTKTKELIKDMTLKEILEVQRYSGWDMTVLAEKKFKFHPHPGIINEKLAELAIDNILLGKDPSDIE